MSRTVDTIIAPRILRLGSNDKPVVFAAGFVLLILLVGTGYTLYTQGSAPLLQMLPPSGTGIWEVMALKLGSAKQVFWLCTWPLPSQRHQQGAWPSARS